MPQKCWCLVKSPECLKERPQVQVKELIRGVLAAQTSPTPADAHIHTYMHAYIHTYISC